MTRTPHNPRPGSRRWTQVALTAALLLYGIAGFPRPGDPDPSPAAAHPLPGWPHSHGGNPICTAFGCPPPDDGTGNDRPGNRPGNNRPGNRPGDPQPPPNCVGVHADGCEQGVDQGYINPDDDLDAPIQEPNRIAQMGDQFAEHNDDVDFDHGAFSNAMDDAEHPPRRGDVADALCAAISGCSATGDEAIQYLLDNDISFGQVADTVEGFNAERPVTIGQVGSFFHRLPETREDSGGNGGGRGGGGGGDLDEEACTTGLDLSEGARSLFVSQLSWQTLVNIESQGEPGRPWPPHPEVPGGTEYLVVSGSPVWPVIDPGASWYVASDDGCLWEAISVQTRLTQLLPWRTSHRSMIETADAARPDAGFDTYLRRWDNLTAAQQSRAQQYHRDRDVSESCAFTTATVSVDAYDRCRWELPSPGVWSWQARACFEGIAVDATFHECATFARGVEWFLAIIDYTSGITLRHDAGAGAEHRHTAPIS